MLETKKQKNVSIVVFGIYLVLLSWLILFKFSINFSNLGHIRNINLIPFHEPLIINGKVQFREIYYNVLVFVPFGVYLHIFKFDWSFLKKIVPCLCLSLIFEVLQFIFAIGASDITDVMANTLGGMIGIAAAILFHKIFKNKFITIVNVLGLIILSLAILMIGLLTILWNRN